jgi:hypothetical protein
MFARGVSSGPGNEAASKPIWLYMCSQPKPHWVVYNEAFTATLEKFYKDRETTPDLNSVGLKYRLDDGFIENVNVNFETMEETRNGERSLLIRLASLECSSEASAALREKYSCVTCGLVGDRGCCSVCVQTCHRGHELGFLKRSAADCACTACGAAKRRPSVPGPAHAPTPAASLMTRASVPAPPHATSQPGVLRCPMCTETRANERELQLHINAVHLTD